MRTLSGRSLPIEFSATLTFVVLMQNLKVLHQQAAAQSGRLAAAHLRTSQLGPYGVSMPYEILDHLAPVGGRIAFRHSEPDDDPAEYVTPARLAGQGIRFAYIDGSSVNEAEALNSLGRQLQTDNPPYDPHPSKGMKGWYRFMDDLETLGEQEAGMVIVVDNAAPLFADPASWVFELITVWVLQLQGWRRRGVPCHLTFQMDPDLAVASIYGTTPKGS